MSLIKYNNGGVVAERRITVSDLKAAGVEEGSLPDKDLVWSTDNRFLVDGTDLSQHVLEIVKGEPGFKFLEPESRAAERAQAATPVVAGQDATSTATTSGSAKGTGAPTGTARSTSGS